jgi:FKBP-type peptidyl-prolyl cis-trans isomerase FkpA
MKKIVFPLFLLMATCFASCKKSDCNLTPPQVTVSATEITTIQNYLTAGNLTATQHSSGLFYKVINEGSGETPTLCSSVTVKYKGTLTDGTIFDQSSTNVSFPLSNLIDGWKHGIPLIKKGGKILLYIPPSLGYGSASQSGIPGNSTLIFDIDLVGVVK